jgi:hypothetical protein
MKFKYIRNGNINKEICFNNLEDLFNSNHEEFEFIKTETCFLEGDEYPKFLKGEYNDGKIGVIGTIVEYYSYDNPHCPTCNSDCYVKLLSNQSIYAKSISVMPHVCLNCGTVYINSSELQLVKNDSSNDKHNKNYDKIYKGEIYKANERTVVVFQSSRLGAIKIVDLSTLETTNIDKSGLLGYFKYAGKMPENEFNDIEKKVLRKIYERKSK